MVTSSCGTKPQTLGARRQIGRIALSLIAIALSTSASRLSADPVETVPLQEGAQAVSYGCDPSVCPRFAMLSSHSWNVFLYDSQGTLSYAAGYTYHEGHVYSAQQVEVGIVPKELDGWVYNADNVCIGILCLSVATDTFLE